jgi:hypothetical protein
MRLLHFLVYFSLKLKSHAHVAQHQDPHVCSHCPPQPTLDAEMQTNPFGPLHAHEAPTLQSAAVEPEMTSSEMMICEADDVVVDVTSLLSHEQF